MLNFLSYDHYVFALIVHMNDMHHVGYIQKLCQLGTYLGGGAVNGHIAAEYHIEFSNEPAPGC